MLKKMHERAARLNEIAAQPVRDWELLSYVALEFSCKVNDRDFDWNIQDKAACLRTKCFLEKSEGNQLSARLLHGELGRLHRRRIAELDASSLPSTEA